MQQEYFDQDGPGRHTGTSSSLILKLTINPCFIPFVCTFERAGWFPRFTQYLEAITCELCELCPHNTLSLMGWPVSLFSNPLSQRDKDALGHSPPPCVLLSAWEGCCPYKPTQKSTGVTTRVICLDSRWRSSISTSFSTGTSHSSLFLRQAPPNCLLDKTSESLILFFLFHMHSSRRWNMLIILYTNFSRRNVSSWVAIYMSGRKVIRSPGLSFFCF